LPSPASCVVSCRVVRHVACAVVGVLIFGGRGGDMQLVEKISREPLGVIANIAPWNYPWFVSCNVYAPALLTGTLLPPHDTCTHAMPTHAPPRVCVVCVRVCDR
jgi:hypothetical protein